MDTTPPTSPSVGVGSAGTALSASLSDQSGIISLAIFDAIFGTSVRSKEDTAVGSRSIKTACTFTSFSVTMVTIVKDICAAFAGTMPCQPKMPSGWRMSKPYTEPSTYWNSGIPRKLIG